MTSHSSLPPNPSEINPAMFEMLKGIGEKKPKQKKGAFSLKSLDAFGAQPSFSYNYNATFKTKVGVFWTMLSVLTLSFAVYIYVFEYIFCTDPSVSTQFVYGLIPENAAHNNLNEIMAPGFMFSHLSSKIVGGKKEQVVDLPSDATLRCHFDFYAEFYTTNFFDFESIPVKVPLKRDCDSHKLKWDKHSAWESPQGALLNKLSTFYCIDTSDMSIYGDHAWCIDGCGYYKITIKQRSDSVRASCPSATTINPDLIVVTTIMMDNYINVEDFRNPWSIYEKAEDSQLDTTLRQNMFIWFQEKKLVTQSHGMGFLDEDKNESRLSFNSLSYKYNTIPAGTSSSSSVP